MCPVLYPYVVFCADHFMVYEETDTGNLKNFHMAFVFLVALGFEVWNLCLLGRWLFHFRLAPGACFGYF